jgi:hypothetical protein
MHLVFDVGFAAGEVGGGGSVERFGGVFYQSLG